LTRKESLYVCARCRSKNETGKGQRSLQHAARKSIVDVEGILAQSFWKTKEDAERYRREDYAKISEMIQHLVHNKPKVHAFDVETSTCHKTANGQSA
jgi:hypothetical protein